MKNELLKPDDIIEIKLEDEKYICIVANIDGAYRLISLNDGYDFMVDEEGHDFRGYTRDDLEKYLANWDWKVIKYYEGLEEFLVNNKMKMIRKKIIEKIFRKPLDFLLMRIYNNNRKIENEKGVK